MPRKSSKKKAGVVESVEIVADTPPPPKAASKVTPVEEEDEVAWVRKQLSAASKDKPEPEQKEQTEQKEQQHDDIRDAINDPDSEFKFMPPDTNRSTASLAMVSAEEAAAPAKRGRKPKDAKAAPVDVKPAAEDAKVVVAPPKPTGKPAWLLAQEKAQAARTETVVAKPASKAAEFTDDSKAVKKTEAPGTLRIRSAATPVAAPVAVPAVKPAAAAPVVKAVTAIEITPARVDMAVGKEHTSRMLPNQQVVTRIFSGIYNAEPCDSDVNGLF
jgi:hypothetical protein